jgi:hypothetical protein
MRHMVVLGPFGRMRARRPRRSPITIHRRALVPTRCTRRSTACTEAGTGRRPDWQPRTSARLGRCRRLRGRGCGRRCRDPESSGHRDRARTVRTEAPALGPGPPVRRLAHDRHSAEASGRQFGPLAPASRSRRAVAESASTCRKHHWRSGRASSAQNANACRRRTRRLRVAVARPPAWSCRTPPQEAQAPPSQRSQQFGSRSRWSPRPITAAGAGYEKSMKAASPACAPAGLR